MTELNGSPVGAVPIFSRTACGPMFCITRASVNDAEIIHRKAEVGIAFETFPSVVAMKDAEQIRRHRGQVVDVIGIAAAGCLGRRIAGIAGLLERCPSWS